MSMMTKNKKAKRTVRERMAETGESYTTARAAMLRTAVACGYCAADLTGRRQFLAYPEGRNHGLAYGTLDAPVIGCSADHARRAAAGEKELKFEPLGTDQGLVALANLDPFGRHG